MMRACSRAERHGHAANPLRIYLILIEVETKRLRGRLTTTTPDDSARSSRGIINSTICDWHHHFYRSI
jgi:hypothetical protein